MKARNRKTGEVVDIISYGQLSVAERCPSLDYVSYIDSNGVEHEKESLNYYWDFELIGNTQDHWQDVRERAAIASLHGLLANPHSCYSDGSMKEGIVSSAVWKGYELVGRLKEEQKEEKERIEVKKVDFAKEFDDFTESLGLTDKFVHFSDIEQTAKFFFQLGLKAQK